MIFLGARKRPKNIIVVLVRLSYLMSIWTNALHGPSRRVAVPAKCVVLHGSKRNRSAPTTAGSTASTDGAVSLDVSSSAARTRPRDRGG